MFDYAKMIRRFFCLLLVPLMLANQGLLFAHAHHGTDVGEPEGHASRPHFHFRGHGHHDSTHNHSQHSDHSHGDPSMDVPASDEYDDALPPVVSPVGEHDSDAVYGVETVTVARDGNSVSVLSAKYVAVAVIFRVVDQSDDYLLRLGPLRGQPESVFDTACPIYLRTLSLRI